MAHLTSYKIVSGDEKDSAGEPFLSQNEDVETHGRVTVCTSRRYLWLRWAGIHFCLASLYIVIIGAIFAFYLPSRCPGHDTHYYFPAQNTLSYENRLIETVYDGNPFAGDPRPEHEEAWFNLLKNSHISVSGDELRRQNQSSIQLKDGKYVAQLGVYHQLHCIRWIRKWIHHEHYWPELRDVMLEERKRHIDHCMELLRLNAMCRPDLTLGTFRWFGSRPTPVLTHMAQCVDFGKLDQWSAERKVNLYDLDSLADRPPTEDWEPKDHAVILGEKMGEAGEVEGFSKALLDAEPQLIDVVGVGS